MHAVGNLRCWRFKQAICDSGACTLEGLLARLKQQLNRTAHVADFVLVGFKDASGPQQRRGMHVVAARMHAAIGAHKRLARFLFHRQRIHISAQHNRVSTGSIVCCAILGSSASAQANQAYHTRTLYQHAERNLHFAQTCLHKRTGLRQVETQLGHLMQLVTPRGKFLS